MRRSGVLLHVSSLPSPGGIGTMGKEAYDFIRWLRDCGMSIWQVLPIGPVGYGESPYQSPCTHAGNVLFIDLRTLRAEGLLPEEAETYYTSHPDDPERVRRGKMRGLKASFDEYYEPLKEEVASFADAHPDLKDYALYMAVKNYFGSVMWTEWPDISIRLREEKAVEYYSRILRDDVNFHLYTQYLFFKQWKALRSFAKENGITIFGDMPIYVAEDSSDTWANPEMFQLDRDRRPVKVAGVPPDYFSADGQLWGNPLYNWRALRKDGFAWWLKRLHTAGELYDMVRIDHFIGFANYYAIKAGAKTARVGKWEKAPGFAFFKKVRRTCPELTIIAEDLGVVSKRVKRLLRFCGYPGMKVLSFGFDGDETNPHFPDNISENCVFYTGTHDNDTAEGWWAAVGENTEVMARKYLPERDSIHEAMIEAVLGSRAETVIIPMQDILGLGSEGRMNTPGTVGAPNWRWRMKAGDLRTDISMEMKDMNQFFERNDL